MAKPSDRTLLWRWANDASVRQNAFDQRPITWEDHVRWFEQVLVANDRILLIAEDDNEPVGQIRFDRQPDGAFETDVSIGAAHRGRGLAPTLIRAGLERLTSLQGAVLVRALVLPHNAASRRSFETAGFEPKEQREDGTIVLETTTSAG